MNHHVEPGTGPLTFDIGGGVVCHKLSVGSMDNNAYLLEPPQGSCVLIDAAAEPDRLLALTADRDIATLVTTHRHHDHIGATAAFVSQTGAEPVCGAPDAAAIEADTGVACRGVWDGDRIPLGDGALDVIGLVGHTPGSITLAWTPKDGPTHLFVGDSLFPGGIGKTWSPADFESLLTDVRAKLFDRFEDAVVHPGHGDSTTLAVERPHLAEWRERGW